MMIKLDQLESKLQALVEDQLAGLLPGQKTEERIIQRIATALKQNIIEKKEDGAIAPNVFTLIVPPESSPLWQEQGILELLKNIIVTASREVGLKVVGTPTVTITTDNNYTMDELSVVASHKLAPVGDTKGMENPGPDQSSDQADAIPENAFLIVEGVKVFSLVETLVNIGRRLDNHLVIDDPRVSRNHAQLRSIKGRFVLFDLSSTGGTFVNGQRTSQTVLYPGDVISLAGVTLIFGQDNPPLRPELTDTSPVDISRSGASERPTAAGEHGTVDIKTGTLNQDKTNPL
jgi:hypothetical protein